ncbi:tRNA(Ile)-lysidine synthetase [uncultured bacterium]|nr:tRNA(Ile)-lysidine synthetase [uncultured bacterium]
MKKGFLFINTIQNKYKISIGYSGGTDSSYILQSICFKKKAYKYLFIMYIFNDSDYHDQIYKVLNTFHHYNISIFVGFGKENLINTHISQNKYRNLKNNFIFETLKYNLIHKIIICHNYNDNFETMIMKWNINCSIKEFFMPYINKITYFGHDIIIIRPMLNISRYIIEREIKPIILDNDNNNLKYIRSKIRNLNIINFLFKNTNLNIFNQIFKLTNYYSNQLYNLMQFSLEKKFIFFKNKYNSLYNFQLIKQASFLLIHNYTAKFNYKFSINRLNNKVSFCINSCSVKFNKCNIEVRIHRFFNQIIEEIHNNIYMYNIRIYNFMRIEILSYFKLNIIIKNNEEIYIQIDNIIFNISISKLFFLTFICIKNCYIIIILYISNYIKIKT